MTAPITAGSARTQTEDTENQARIGGRNQVNEQEETEGTEKNCV